MYLFVGLGNPGEEYARTRHNAGFLAIDAFHGQATDFGGWKMKKQANAEVSEGRIAGQKIILAKPHMFMNDSGRAVASLARTHKIKPEDIVIIYDEMNIDLGNLKLSFGGSAGGHNGVHSIIASLATRDFWRLRIGIGPRQGAMDPSSREREGMDAFVLKKFAKIEQKILDSVLAKAAVAIGAIAALGPQKAQNAINADGARRTL